LRDWVLRYLPAELAWLRGIGSRGMRTAALRALWWPRRPAAPATASW
jgi:hypothetical protein